jgi:hypothetical protein
VISPYLPTLVRCALHAVIEHRTSPPARRVDTWRDVEAIVDALEPDEHAVYRVQVAMLRANGVLS